jgi:hypothetical protein
MQAMEWELARVEVASTGEDFPEMRLWKAIVIQAIHEYEEWLGRIQREWLKYGEPVDIKLYNTLQLVRYECTCHWFRYVCDMADVEHEQVMRKFIQLEKHYGLINVRFGEVECSSVISQSGFQESRRRSRKQNA